MTNSASKKATLAKRMSILPKCNAISHSTPITPRQNKATQIDPMIFFMVLLTSLAVKTQKATTKSACILRFYKI